MKFMNLTYQHHPQLRPKPPVEQRVQVMDTLDKNMNDIINREDLPTDERLKLYDQALNRYLHVHDEFRPKPVTDSKPDPVVQQEPSDPIANEVLASVPKTMKGKAELLLNKMKTSPDITWNEKGELKFKGETVHGSNVVDLVNDVLRKRKYFNPQGWETFGEALREANVPQDLIGHEDRWRYITQTKRTPRARKRQQSPSPTRYETPPATPKTPRTPRRRWIKY